MSRGIRKLFTAAIFGVVGKEINMEQPCGKCGLPRQRSAIGGGIPVGGVAGVPAAREGPWNALGWALEVAGSTCLSALLFTLRS